METKLRELEGRVEALTYVISALVQKKMQGPVLDTLSAAAEVAPDRVAKRAMQNLRDELAEAWTIARDLRPARRRAAPRSPR